MRGDSQSRARDATDMETLLKVAIHLAESSDLITMLTEVVSAAKQVLNADASSIWLYDATSDELVLHVARDLESVRVPAGTGFVGTCARERKIINVPDCYADPRFNREIDKRSDYRTRCMLTLPLVDNKDALVGVLQVLNKANGVFDRSDEALAAGLAAHCAIALQRARMTETIIDGERMRQQLEMARVVQMSTLPAVMPTVQGYDVFGTFKPADLTGGDTFDLALFDQGLLVVLADATGHGIAPALHVTQMHAMLRMAFRMGADLETAFVQVNNQLADNLPDDRFITAFVGILDAAEHRLRFQSAGQAPILFYKAESGDCEQHSPTSFPLAAMPIIKLRPTIELEMAPGDILVLLSDGIFEYHNRHNDQFGEQRVAEIVAANREKSMAELSSILLDAVSAFADGAPQEDDITVVLVKRAPDAGVEQRAFERGIAELGAIFAFTAHFFERNHIDSSLLQVIDFTIEELFTNMVKYSRMSSSAVDVRLTAIAGGIEVDLTDHDVDRFDVTSAPDVDVNRPIEERTPGGLGLHLIRRMVDSIEYRYDADRRRSRTTFRKTLQKDRVPQEAAPRRRNADN